MINNSNILLVAGTHGNELNAPWLFNEWNKKPSLIELFDLKCKTILGNPQAIECCKRYIDRDLNRSFSDELLNDIHLNDLEVLRAREILKLYGPYGELPSKIVIDFHSTTAVMGSSIVIYGRRKADLMLAGLIQHRIGLPIYLHEEDPKQTGFLVEKWPCGIVVEIGPVAQGLLDKKIVSQNKLVLETCLDEISKFKLEEINYPEKVYVHSHVASLDYPRDDSGHISSLINSEMIYKNWIPLNHNLKIFELSNRSKESETLYENLTPVFINEAAYMEKNIALSFTKKETININKAHIDSLKNLISNN